MTATWNANTETDIAGYRLSYGTQSGTYTTTVDVGNVTSYAVTGLVAGTTYYFAVQAYDTSGLLSAYSTEVPFTVPSSTATPTITSLSPTSGAVGTAVTITGSNFGSTQGSSSVTFNGVAASPTTWSGTSIKVPVPAGATTGNVVVTVNGVASNGAPFTVTTTASPTITSLSPTAGSPGTAVTIVGSNFGSTQGTSTVTFNGVVATPSSWSATTIVASVPANATTGPVVVTVGGTASNGVVFDVTLALAAPTITSVSPTSGSVGTAVTIAGSNFGSTQGTSTVAFNGVVATTSSWSDTSIVAAVPSGATSGNVVVSVNGVASNGVPFTVTTTATITFKQLNYKAPQTAQSTVSVVYSGAQTAGDTNVVVVGWNDSAVTVRSVTDAVGNTYVKAVGPTIQSAVATQAIYYSAGIAPAAAGGNSVTVTFSGAARYPDIRIAEYSGIDTVKPVDVVAAAKGNSLTSNSGLFTTTNAHDLLFAANLVQTSTSGAGSGFKNRGITADGDIAEDRIVSSAGGYRAKAPLTTSGRWIMQAVAFRAASAAAATTLTAAASAPLSTTSTATTTPTATATTSGTTTADVPVLADYDGDGKADLATYQPSSAQWRIRPSGGTAGITATLGGGDDVAAPGDFDGDHHADIAVFSPSAGTWSILTSLTHYAAGLTVAVGGPGDVPAAGDYDGDGRTDIAVYNPGTGTWTILLSSSNFGKTVALTLGGGSGDVPVPADYDGDGKTDPAVYTPSTGRWRILMSTTHFASVVERSWGISGDVPVPGDYDGDGKADPAVYRPSDGTWRILGSSAPSAPLTVTATSVLQGRPAAGDFTGTGVMTPALLLPDGTWWIASQKR